MTQWLEQSAAATLPFGPFVDDGDGKTPEEGLTISQADIRLSKNGGAFAQSNNAAGATHDENGYYSVPLNTTDTNTLGRLRIAVYESGALLAWQDVMIVPTNVFDSMFGADQLQVEVMDIEGVDATLQIKALCDAALSDYDPPTKAEMDTGHGLLATEAKQDTIDGIVDAILVDTAVIGASGAGLTDLGGMSTGMKAEVEAEANDALVALNLDHLLKTVTAAADMTTEVVDNTILSRVLANGDTSAFVPSTDGLQLIRDKLTDIETDTAVIGALGAGLTDLGGMSTGMKAEVNVEADSALSDYDPPTKAEMDTGHGLLATEAKQDTIDGIVDAILVDTAVIGALGAGLTDLGGMSSGMKTEVGDAVLDEVVEGSHTLRELHRGYSALMLAKVSGADTSTITYRDIDDSKNRVVVTVDADGNRSAISLTLT